MMTEWRDPIGFQARLDRALEEIRAMLLAKNQAYGDSALNPVRVFSQATSAEQIRVRIDDKISRLVRGHDAGEDTATDLLGYLVLLRMAETRDCERAEWERSPAAKRPSAQAGAGASAGPQHDGGRS